MTHWPKQEPVIANIYRLFKDIMSVANVCLQVVIFGFTPYGASEPNKTEAKRNSVTQCDKEN